MEMNVFTDIHCPQWMNPIIFIVIIIFPEMPLQLLDGLH